MKLKKIICLIFICLNLKSAQGPLIESGTLQGGRPTNEDTYIPYAVIPNGLIVAVFDGHSVRGFDNCDGKDTAEFLKNNVVTEFLQCSQSGKLTEEVWKDTIKKLDERNPYAYGKGSTATIVHIDVQEGKIFLIGVGDSEGHIFDAENKIRAMVGKGADLQNGVNAKNLKECLEKYGKGNAEGNEQLIDVDYKEGRIYLMNRAEHGQKMGGRINIATAIGDKHLELPGLPRDKQPVAPIAEIKVVDFPKHPFSLLVCTDGLSDAIENPVDLILQKQIKGEKDIISNLLAQAQLREPKVDDNKTAVLVRISGIEQLSEFINTELQKQVYENKGYTYKGIIFVGFTVSVILVALAYYLKK